MAFFARSGLATTPEFGAERQRPARSRSRAGWLLWPLTLGVLLAGGCGDSSGGVPIEDTAGDVSLDTGAGVDAAVDSAADTGSSDDGALDASDTGASDTAAPDTGDTDMTDTEPADTAPACPGGTLCGQPATCCPSGSECIDGSCLLTCDTGVRCGVDMAVCCAPSTLCLAAQCATPGASCVDSYDCQQPGEFCEPTLGRCLPQPNPLTCELLPQFDQLSLTVEWAWQGYDIISPPLVADVDGDGVQEVVVNATRTDANDWVSGKIVVIDGQTGAEEWRLDHAPPTSYGSHGRSTLALGDVSGDGRPDIVYAGRDNGIYAVDGLGNLLWRAHDAGGTPVFVAVNNGAASLANFDADPQAEVVFGATLLDHDGLVVWNQDGLGPNYGTNLGYQGGIAAIADLDMDGKPEIVTGRDAWKVTWTAGSGSAPPTVSVALYWHYDGDDGYPAVADLDGNGIPEVVLVANGRVVVLNGWTGGLWCGRGPTGCTGDPSLLTQPVAIPGGATNNRGGPPTIADFDDDGRPEVGVAGGWSYSVYDFNRPGEVVVQPVGATPPAPGAIFVRWSQATQDQSSNATGSSVFDFQGDGTGEVVYADECYLRVYQGSDGAVLIERENASATIHEYPIVVDVDSDGNSEILIVANSDGSACPWAGSTTAPTRGVFVYGDANDEWVPTRRVWTQHTYHVTNATSDGNVPAIEQVNWLLSGLNNYRQNVQGEGVFNAPDLAVDLSAGLDGCYTGELELRARVVNVGALGVPAGIPVAFYEGTDATGTLLGTVSTTVALLPGASTPVSFVVPAPQQPRDFFATVDPEDAGAGGVAECHEGNNGEVLTAAQCIVN